MKIYKNAFFVTCEPHKNATHTVMAVDKGRIVWIGDELPDVYRGMPVVD
jgi:predicted amidohydrolase YtcJ